MGRPEDVRSESVDRLEELVREASLQIASLCLRMDRVMAQLRPVRGEESAPEAGWRRAA